LLNTDKAVVRGGEGSLLEDRQYINAGVGVMKLLLATQTDGAPSGGGLTIVTSHPSTNPSISFSPITATPNSRALSSFEPASAPATT